MRPSITPRLGALLLLLSLALDSGRGLAEPPPDFSGSWALDRSASDDATAKVVEVVGPDVMTSALSLGSRFWAWQKGGALGFSPQTSYRADEARVNVRQFLLDMVGSMSQLEIEQSELEVTTIHGDDAVRIFNLGRESTGASAQGAKVVRRARFEAERLVLESEGGKTKLVETFTLSAPERRLACGLRYEAKVLSKPLEVRLVYDRVGTP